MVFLSTNLVVFSTGSAQLNTASQPASLQQATPSALANPTPSPTPGPSPRVVADDVLISRNLPFSTRIDPSDQFFEDELALTFKDNVPEDIQRKILTENNLIIKRGFKKIKAKLIQVDPARRDQVLANLKNNPNIKYAELSYVVRARENTGPTPLCYPDDTYFCLPQNQFHWGLKKIKVPEGWTLKKGSSSVTVAVLDSGIDYNHYDLGLTDPSPGANGGRVVRGVDETTPDGPFNDSIDTLGHGTQVAGIIGAKTNNDQAIAGVDWYSKLVAIKMLGPTGEIVNPLPLAEAILEAINPSTLNHYPDYTAYSPPKANVINISSGLKHDSGLVRDAVNQALNQGVVIVAAADNSPQGYTNCFMGFPAAYPGVISVVATDQNDQHYSGCTGNVVDGQTYQPIQVAAPGKDIFTLDWGYGLTWANGTSLAAPFVSGTASILASCGLTGTAIKNSITQRATDLGSSGWDSTYGYGLVNLWNSLYNDCSGGGSISQVSPQGDVNCDGAINLTDAKKILNYLAGFEAGSNTCSTGVFLPMADVDKNGQVNEFDALYIKQYVDGLRDIQTLNLIAPARDSDNDGLTNNQESIFSCLNPQVNDSQSDPDNDSVMARNIRMNNIVEIVIGSNPCVSDSDGDGFKDGMEAYVGTDPNKSCGVNAWPIDFDNNREVNIFDVAAFQPHFFAEIGQANYDRRFDLNADGTIDIFDVSFLSPPNFFKTCI